MLTITTLIVYPKIKTLKLTNVRSLTPEVKMDMKLCTQRSCVNPPAPGSKTCETCKQRQKDYRAKKKGNQ